MSVTLDVVCGGDARKALEEGKAAQFYESDYRTALDRYALEYPDAECWYTERNGDPITMLVPKGTAPGQLPKTAMYYQAFEWIKPDAEFGSGVFVWLEGRR